MSAKEQIENEKSDVADILTMGLARSVESFFPIDPHSPIAPPWSGNDADHLMVWVGPSAADPHAAVMGVPVFEAGAPVVMPYYGRTLHAAMREAIAGVESLQPGYHLALLDEDTMKLVTQVQDYLPVVRQQQSQDFIHKMLDVLTELEDPLAKPRRKIDVANAKLRIKFMEEVETFPSTEVAELDNRDTANPHNLASRWKKAGKIFAVDWKGAGRFPAFQFDHGKPKPVIGKILKVFDGALGPWETAFWFVSSNKWLDGKAPVDRLEEEAAVLDAARASVGERHG